MNCSALRCMRNVALFIPALAVPATAFAPISLSTQSKLASTPPDELYRFLASPGNWPKIVASSNSVESSGFDLESPIKVGQNVDEIFGLPPILPLSVTWKCVKSIAPSQNRAGRLEFYSVNGVSGIASQCKMNFDIQNNNIDGEGSQLLMEMQFNPQSFIARLATPILKLDNELALKVLLPSVLESMDASLMPIDKFRRLMGTLYGGAGLAHLFDCYFGGSQLLTAAGAPTYESLPLEGQALALLWCVAGPLSYIKSRIGGKVADLGLILYGLVEVAGAAVIRFADGRSPVVVGDMDPFASAVLVQGIVALAWLYSSRKESEEV